MPSNKIIYGLIGYPVSHSLSPIMHNAAFSHLNINAEYKLFEVAPENLEDFLFNSTNVVGFNITIPHKVSAREILEKKFPQDFSKVLVLDTVYYVKLSGAINTVKREVDKLRYYNTDASGFLKSLKKDLGFEAEGKTALVIGCGGAGRSVIAALSWKNVGIAKIYANDINTQASESAKSHFMQFEHLKGKLEFIPTKDIEKVIKDCQLLVNASPIGMKGEDFSPIDKKFLHNDLFVYDVVYNRNKKTRLIEDAESLKLNVVDGLSMLLYQGIDAFNIWTGKEAPIEIMRKALMEAVCK